MKITRKQLGKIIKEEKQKLNEGAREMAALLNAIDVLKDRHGSEYTADVLRDIAEEIDGGEYEHAGYYKD
tara:strand:- start:190 stop:399 length:210 start_codon:yes stop_codon:yes gene_type:complete